jgi:hypothetical protein
MTNTLSYRDADAADDEPRHTVWVQFGSVRLVYHPRCAVGHVPRHNPGADAVYYA